MSKGSSYWGTARGKIGNTVVSVVKGQRIEKAYQPNVTNPRTDAQQQQRALFANAVKFYKRAASNFFAFAYEDRKQVESDYNAFMRYNSNSNSSVLNKLQVQGTYPAVGNNWIISAGSLASPTYKSGDNASYYVSLPSANATTQTVAALSQALITDEGLQEGDIITIVRIATTIKALTDANPTQHPTWQIKQLILSTTDTTPLANIDAYISLSTGEGLYLDNQSRATAYWYGIVYSRKVSGGLQVSTSRLVGNAAALNLYYQAQEDTWIQTALKTWSASGTATLAGAAVTYTLMGTIDTVAGDAIPRISDTVLDAGVSSTAKLLGRDLNHLQVSDFTGVGLKVQSLNIINSTEAEITVVGTGSHPYSWVLQYGSTVIAQHSQVTAQITNSSPATIDVLDKGDTATITLIGNYVDAIKPADMVVDDDNLVITSITSTSSTHAVMVVTAKAQVSSATIKYGDTTVLTIEEARPTITSNAVDLNAGTNTITINGTKLSSLTAASFDKPSAWVVSSYTASADGTSAVLVVTVSGEGSIMYGALTIGTYSMGGDE